MSLPVISGGDGVAGSTYTYIKADPDELYDVVVTLNALDPGNPATITSPLGGNDALVVTGPDVPSYFTPRWTFTDGAVASTYTAYMDFTISLYYTGTSTPASLKLYAMTYDNDSQEAGSNFNILERVTYSPTADTYLLSPDTTQTQSGDSFTSQPGTAVIGISTAPSLGITAIYNDASSFNWTSAHIIDDLAAEGGGPQVRRGAIGLSYEIVPEPSGPLLLAVAALTGLVWRRRGTAAP